ncbi:hypothetical protein BT93_E2530 [Corymbia citriodora subsp. variegata]|nr:hypothetical protein BT93_E2530 [Corymbia citriodora subsp. variegata]
MSLFSSLFSCFSDHSNSRVISLEGEDHSNKSRSIRKHSRVEGEGESKKNNSRSKSKPPPIPMSYFPVGSQLSRL